MDAAGFRLAGAGAKNVKCLQVADRRSRAKAELRANGLMMMLLFGVLSDISRTGDVTTLGSENQ